MIRKFCDVHIPRRRFNWEKGVPEGGKHIGGIVTRQETIIDYETQPLMGHPHMYGSGCSVSRRVRIGCLGFRCKERVKTQEDLNDEANNTYLIVYL
jgi:hypothetical protein